MIAAVRKTLILLRYRERLAHSVVSDIRSKYGGSLLGVAWVFVYPLMQLLIYAVLYAFIFRVKPPSLTVEMYIIFVFAGMVPLMAFNEAIMSATSSLIANRSLLLNTVFPAELIPVRAVLSAQSSSLISLFIAIVAGMIFGAFNWKVIVFVPFFWVNLIMFTVGLSWILSLISLVIRDIQHGLSLVLMLLFVMSPFAYTPEMVPNALKFIIYFNPLSYFVFCFQDLICFGRIPNVSNILIVVSISFLSFFCGLAFFDRVKGVFFDYA